jgi:hypothetical protein
MKIKIVMNQDKNRVELDIIVLKWDWREEGKGGKFGWISNDKSNLMRRKRDCLVIEYLIIKLKTRERIFVNICNIYY